MPDRIAAWSLQSWSRSRLALISLTPELSVVVIGLEVRSMSITEPRDR
jgi:hypothetical protein